MTWKSQGETDVIIKPEYQFRIEEFRDGEDHQMVFLHLNVSSWTPTVAKEIIRNWKLFRQCVPCHVYGVCGEGDTAKWERFVSALGFQPLMNIVCENGQERRLFVHSINKNNKNEQPVLEDDKREPEFQSERQRHDQPLVSASPVSDASVRRRI